MMDYFRDPHNPLDTARRSYRYGSSSIHQMLHIKPHWLWLTEYLMIVHECSAPIIDALCETAPIYPMFIVLCPSILYIKVYIMHTNGRDPCGFVCFSKEEYRGFTTNVCIHNTYDAPKPLWDAIADYLPIDPSDKQFVIYDPDSMQFIKN